MRSSELPDGFHPKSWGFPWGWRPEQGRNRDSVLTHGGSLEVGGEEEGGEADEGSHAGGLLPVALAVLGEDVDLGGLEAEAGVDLDHAAGPAGWGEGMGWDPARDGTS